jgi:DNA-binding NarL/FixJ family response regulator
MIDVVIADDHHLVRQGIRALLEKERDIRVVGEAKDGNEAIELVTSLSPDVLVLDINMPRLGGIEATKLIRTQDLPTQILILSMYSDESLVKKAFRNGARGYLLKQSVTEELLSAVRSVSHWEFYISPALSDIIGTDLIDIGEVDVDPFETLTPREIEIFKLVAEGSTNSAISYNLKISVKTVEKHRASLMEKLGVYDLAGLVRAAVKHGVIFVDE